MLIYDLDVGNQGGQYRLDEGVDIFASTEAGGNGYGVGWARPGEWLAYNIDVSSTGMYDVEVRVAYPGGGGVFHLEVGGVDVTGPMTVPTTGGNFAFQTIVKPGVALSAGPQVMRLVLDSPSSYDGAGVGNFEYISVLPASTPVSSCVVVYPTVAASSDYYADFSSTGWALTDSSGFWVTVESGYTYTFTKLGGSGNFTTYKIFNGTFSHNGSTSLTSTTADTFAVVAISGLGAEVQVCRI